MRKIAFIISAAILCGLVSITHVAEAADLMMDLNAGRAESYPGSGRKWTDLTGNGNHAVDAGFSPGVSANFDGSRFDMGGFNSGHHFTVPTFSNFRDSTGSIEVWFNSTAATNGLPQNLFGFGSDRRLTINDDQYEWRFMGSIMKPPSPANTGSALDKVHQLVVTHDGLTSRLYLDGNEIDSEADTNWAENVPGSERALTLGAAAGQTGFPGYLHIARYYDDALTPAEVANNFQYSGPLTRYEQWQQNRPFTSSAWYSDGVFGPAGQLPPLSELPDMQTFREAGLNSIVDATISNGGHETLPSIGNAQAAGVPFMFRTPGAWGPPWDFETFQDYADAVAGDPSWSTLSGFFLADEPHGEEGRPDPETRQLYRQRRDYLVDNYPDKLILVGEGMGGASYLHPAVQSQVTADIDEIAPDVMVLQFYPTHFSAAGGLVNPLYFAALDFYEDLTTNRGVAMWTYPQTAFRGAPYSDSTLRLEKFGAVVHGAKGFVDFGYDMNWIWDDRDQEQGYVKAVPVGDGTDTHIKTTTFSVHAQINHEIRNLADVLVHSNFVRGYHVDLTTQAISQYDWDASGFLWRVHRFNERNSDGLTSSRLVDVSSDTDSLVVSFFNDANDNELFTVLNKNNDPLLGSGAPSLIETVTLTFENDIDSIWKMDRELGVWNELQLTVNGQYLFNLPGGTADLFGFAPFLPELALEWDDNRSGDWNNPGNWSTGTFPNGAADHVTFGTAITSPQTVYSNADVTAKSVTFDNAQTYAVTGTGTLYLQSLEGAASLAVTAGSHEFQLPVSLQSDTDVQVADGAVVTFQNFLHLNGNSLHKMGSGMLVINSRLMTGGGTVIGKEGMIAGSGSVTGSLTNSGATVSPGNRQAMSAGQVVPEPATWLLLSIGAFVVSTAQITRQAGRK